MLRLRRRYLNYSAVTRGDTPRVSSLSSKCQRINLVYCTEIGLPPRNCLTIQFASSSNARAFWTVVPNYHMCRHASYAPERHAFVIIIEVFRSLFFILMTDFSIKLESIFFENFAKTVKY